MPLQEFTQVRGQARNPEVRMSVRKNGTVGLNAAAVKVLGQPTHLVLLFDSETLDFGVRTARPEEPHRYKIQEDSRGRAGASVTANALWQYYDVAIEQYVGSYDAHLEGDALVIRLRKT